MTAVGIQITILVDNHTTADLSGEHGLSLWIETGDRKILYDTGQGKALPMNAEILGIALESAHALILSHGHYDHTGGVSRVLRCNPTLHLYCHPGAVQPRYAMRNGQARCIQMPPSAMAAIDKIPEQQLHWVSQPTLLSEAIGLSGPIPRLNTYEDTGGPFFLDTQGHRPDPIDDDLALWIGTPEGLVVVVGCCHAGLINTLNHIRSISGMDDIAAVIGGFHLLQADRQRMASTIADLRNLSPRTIVPCHCTGDAAMAELANVFPDIIMPGYAGMHLSF